MPDLKKLMIISCGMILMLAAQAAAQGAPGSSLPSPSDFGGLFGSRTGDAYSSVLLNELFGPLFPSAALAEGAAGNATVFSSIIGFFNVIVLVIGGLMFFYNVTVGVLQSAHEGEVLGKGWSSLWAPIRVLFAVGLLVPVPNYGGYNLAQVGVAYVVKGSTNIATEVWKESVNLILRDGIPIASSQTRFSTDAIRSLYDNAACMALLNYQYGPNGTNSNRSVGYDLTNNAQVVAFGALRTDGYRQAFPRFVANTYVYNGDRRENPGICGSFSTPDVPAYILRVLDENPDSTIAQEIMTKYVEGHRDLLIEVSRQITDELVIGTGAAAPIRDDVFDSIMQPALFTNELREISEFANLALNALAQELRAMANSADGHGSVTQGLRDRITGGDSCTRQSLSADNADAQPSRCYGEGWIGAGSYYTTLARMNAEINSLTAAQPTVQGPLYLNQGHPSGITQGQFISDNGGAGFFWGLNSVGERLPSSEEAARVLSRYADLYSSSAYPLAALGFNMLTADIINANSDVGVSTEGFLNQIGRWMGDGIQNVQAGLLKFFDPANSVGGDPMMGLIATGNMLIILGFVLLGASMIGVRVAVVMVPFFSVIFAAGATLTFVLPLMPFFYWVLGVTGYFLLIAEAIIAVNLWALAHMRMDGDGISGAAGQKGWLMLLALLMTPVLMVFGFLLGMGIFRVTSSLISSGMFYAVSGISGASSWIVSLMGIIAFSILIVSAYIFLLERSFSLISEFPNRVMQWMGEGINIGGGEDRIRAAAAAAAVGTNAIGNSMEKPFTRVQKADGTLGNSRAQDRFKTAVSKIPGFRPKASGK